MTFRHVGFKKTNLRAGMHNHCLYGRHLTSPSSVYLLYYNSLFSRKLRVASCGICTDIKFFSCPFLLQNRWVKFQPTSLQTKESTRSDTRIWEDRLESFWTLLIEDVSKIGWSIFTGWNHSTRNQTSFTMYNRAGHWIMKKNTLLPSIWGRSA